LCTLNQGLQDQQVNGQVGKYPKLAEVCKTILNEAREAGTYKVERVIENNTRPEP
jgi:hypothetical protein